METIPLGVYRHFKGNYYRVVGFAKHSETLEDLVVYTPLYGQRATWVRPLSMWEETVTVGDQTVKRFTYIGDTEDTGEQHALQEAHRAIRSTIGKCEKAQQKFNEGTAQHTLLKRRLEAFYIAISLIEQEIHQKNQE